MSNNLDAKKLARMQKEVAFLQSQQRGARRIKLNKGQTITVRFLPAKLGTDEMWYVRIAQHWLNKVPITCARLTGDDLGGNYDAHCPVCELADQLNDDPDKEISKFGWSVKAGPQYMTYCLLLERDGVPLPMEEILNPYEFRLNKSTWEELHGFYNAGLRKSPDSVLDYRKGNDFSVMRTAKGTRLDKLDSQPIFDEDKHFDAHIRRIEQNLKTPRIQIPTQAQIEAFADKVQAAVLKIGGGSSEEHSDDDEAPRSRRSTAVDEDAPAPRTRRQAPVDEDAPAPRSRRAAVNDDVDEVPAPRSRRSAPADQEVESPAPRARKVVQADEDDVDYSPSPVSRSARTVEAPRARRAAPKQDDFDAEDPATADDDVTDTRDADGLGESDPEKDSDTSSDNDPEEIRPARGAAKNEEIRGKLTPTANRARSAAPADEDEELPEETKDLAPPAETLPRQRPDVDDDEDVDPPPQVERRGKTADAIKSRLSSLSKRNV